MNRKRKQQLKEVRLEQVRDNYRGMPVKHETSYQKKVFLDDKQLIANVPEIRNVHRGVVERESRRMYMDMIPDNMEKIIFTRKIQRRAYQLDNAQEFFKNVTDSNTAQGFFGKSVVENAANYAKLFVKGLSIELGVDKSIPVPVDE